MLKNLLTPLCIILCSPIAVAQTPATTDTNKSLTEEATPTKTVKGEVTRALFTSEIQEREPTDTLTQTNASIQQIYFFTELTELEGQTITHRWSFLGENMAEINFNVAGNRWRVWSSKQMMPHWLGDWKVEVVAADGSVLSSETLNYTAAKTSETPQSPPTQTNSTATEQ